MALYVPDRFVQPILDAGKRLVESSGSLIQDPWEIVRGKVVAEYCADEHAFRENGNYSVGVTYVGSVSIGRMTGLSFQSSEVVWFNCLGQKQPDQNKYVLYRDPELCRDPELRNPRLFLYDQRDVLLFD